MRLLTACCCVHSRLQLNLSWNNLGPEGGKALAPGLVSTSLTVLILSYNTIKDAGAIAIGHALRDNADCKVQTLELNNCGIGAGGAKALAAFCAVSGSLTALKLGENKIGDDGAVSIASALKENTQSRLAELDLNGFGAGDMKIGPRGAKALADMLVVTGSLTSVSACP